MIRVLEKGHIKQVWRIPGARRKRRHRNNRAHLQALMYSVREMKMFLLHPRPLLFRGKQTGGIVSKFTSCLGDESGEGQLSFLRCILIFR